MKANHNGKQSAIHPPFIVLNILKIQFESKSQRAGLRYNHQMIFNDKVYKNEGVNDSESKSTMILSDFSFVIRKTL